jgi:hypothetical protein
MNSRQVRRQFRAMWRDACASRPALATDKPAMREAFANYVDMLHRDGRISERVACHVTLGA